MWPDQHLLRLGWSCRCPRCQQGNLYRSLFDLNLNERCPACGLDFSRNDSADGPAVFLIFILGFLLVPLALMLAAVVNWPLWLHGLLWGSVALCLTVGMLRPLKAYIIALQYKHRPKDWGD